MNIVEEKDEEDDGKREGTGSDRSRSRSRSKGRTAKRHRKVKHEANEALRSLYAVIIMKQFESVFGIDGTGSIVDCVDSILGYQKRCLIHGEYNFIGQQFANQLNRADWMSAKNVVQNKYFHTSMIAQPTIARRYQKYRLNSRGKELCNMWTFPINMEELNEGRVKPTHRDFIRNEDWTGPEMFVRHLSHSVKFSYKATKHGLVFDCIPPQYLRGYTGQYDGSTVKAQHYVSMVNCMMDIGIIEKTTKERVMKKAYTHEDVTFAGLNLMELAWQAGYENKKNHLGTLTAHPLLREMNELICKTGLQSACALRREFPLPVSDPSTQQDVVECYEMFCSHLTGTMREMAHVKSVENMQCTVCGKVTVLASDRCVLRLMRDALGSRRLHMGEALARLQRRTEMQVCAQCNRGVDAENLHATSHDIVMEADASSTRVIVFSLPLIKTTIVNGHTVHLREELDVTLRNGELSLFGSAWVLVSACEHVGNESMDDGHYVAWTHNGNHWNKFNDDLHSTHPTPTHLRAMRLLCFRKK